MNITFDSSNFHLYFQYYSNFFDFNGLSSTRSQKNQTFLEKLDLVYRKETRPLMQKELILGEADWVYWEFVSTGTEWMITQLGLGWSSRCSLAKYSSSSFLCLTTQKTLGFIVFHTILCNLLFYNTKLELTLAELCHSILCCRTCVSVYLFYSIIICIDTGFESKNRKYDTWILHCHTPKC